MLFVFFFFSSRRRHTRSLCDWSSDVCSSDLERVNCLSDIGVVNWIFLFLPIVRHEKCTCLVHTGLCPDASMCAGGFGARGSFPGSEHSVARDRSEERRVGKEGELWLGAEVS